MSFDEFYEHYFQNERLPQDYIDDMGEKIVKSVPKEDLENLELILLRAIEIVRAIAE